MKTGQLKKYQVPMEKLQLLPVYAVKKPKNDDGWPFFPYRYFRFSCLSYSLSSIFCEQKGRVHLHKLDQAG